MEMLLEEGWEVNAKDGSGEATNVPAMSSRHYLMTAVPPSLLAVVAFNLFYCCRHCCNFFTVIVRFFFNQ